MGVLGFPYSAWNDTDTPYPASACLHDLVVESARKSPDSIAIERGHRRLTYQQVDDASSALSAALIAADVRLETIVALFADHSVETILRIIAVLKAGAAYLPLDRNLPVERIKRILGRGHARFVIGDGDRAIVEGTECRFLDISPIERAPGDAGSAPWISPLNLAYVINTSGSTGEPKAIAVPHRGVVNNITDLNRRFDVDSGDRVMGVSALGFDMSVYELLGTLIAGGTVVLPPVEAHDPDALARAVRDSEITVWNSAPALLQSVIESCERSRITLPKLRLALLGGDWVPLTLPARLRSIAPSARLIVMGGATEASIHSTIFEVEDVDPEWRSVPYGVPMANQRIYVLDEELRPVSAGQDGELFLAGVGLTRGYLGNPVETATRYLPNPFERGQRMYRTGDRVRWSATGRLELIGRVDHQVKIRGVRVELGEVEAVLAKHPAVARVVATVRGERLGDKTLRVAIQANGALTMNEVLRFAADHLPPAMIPSEILFLDAFPLSPNGKVDRRAIAALPLTQGISRSSDQRPETELELLLVDVWRDILGVDEVGIDDDFFALGGHSLLMLRMAGRLRDSLGVQLTLRTLFNAPTVRALAGVLTDTHPDLLR